MTERCYSLKQHLEELAKAGHLCRYLGDGQNQHYHEGPTVTHNTKPMAKVIEMIHTSQPSGQSHDWLRTDFPNSEQQIFFSDEDLRDVQTPHDDPLAVKLRIGDLDVKGIEVNSDQIKAVQELKPPQTHKEVQRLTGMTVALNSPGPAEPLFLYLAVSEQVVSAVLIRIKDTIQCPIYYTSKTMIDAETRYLPLEKVGLALVTAARKLPQYFQAHTIYVVMQYPVQAMFQKANFTGQISKWGAKISALDVKYLLKTAIKGQVLSDFVAELTPASGHKRSSATAFHQDSLESLGWWKIYVDGASNAKGEYMAQDERMAAYLLKVQQTITHFNAVRIEQIGRNLNSHTDALATLAFVLSADFKWFIPIETLAAPSIALPACHAVAVGPCWMDPYVLYLKEGILPEQRKEVEVIRRKAPRFWLSKDSKLYRRSFSRPYLICVHLGVVEDLLYEIHEETIILDNGTQFNSKPFMRYCSKLGIRNIYSSPAYPYSNGQAEASNKTILDGIKKRLEDAKGRWVEELPNVLWTFRTTTRKSTGETLFSLAYGSEAVIPLKIGLPTLRTSEWEPEIKDLAQSQALDLLEERREQVMIRLASYQQQLKKGYNKNVRLRSFQQGDLVLRKVFGNTKNPNDGKLGPNWEGPYRV
uniref:Integrase catalytic domain-containing protein n=1 Tax=Fagus sylvatica TaxID=28930 RepID=A0A2N9HLW7_FAGSY